MNIPKSLYEKIQVVTKIESTVETREMKYATLQEINHLLETAPIGF